MARIHLLWTLGLFLLGEANADVVYRTRGGKVEGTILEDQSTEDRIVLRTRVGIVKLRRSDIQRIERSDEPESSYEDVAENYGETADDQYSLALWCLEHRRPVEYRKHLERTITLDPDHEEARRRLGYQRYEGEWATREEILRARGMVRHQGRFVLPQEREEAERQAEIDTAKQAFHRRIRAAREGLRKGDAKRRQKALKEMQSIRDPLAIEPLVKLLGDEGTVAERATLIRLLHAIPGDASTNALFYVAIQENDEQNQWDATLALIPRKDPAMVRRAVQLLGNAAVFRVRNAAVLLGEIGDDAVVPSLVDALVTRHRYVRTLDFFERARMTGGLGSFPIKPIRVYATPEGHIVRDVDPTQIPQEGSVISSAPAPPEKIVRIVEHRNPESLHALTKLTGEDFGYDREAWLGWIRERDREEAERLAP